MRTIVLSAVLFLTILPAAPSGLAADDDFPSVFLARLDAEGCAGGVEERLESYRQLVAEGRQLLAEREGEMLRRVNRFFYRSIRMLDDRRVWNRVDYWADLVETLCVGDGDSEDFAIAKFFTLLGIGVPEDRMRQVYTRSTWFGPMMVLFYQMEDGSEKVLYHQGIWDLEDVTDGNLLQPVYAFDRQRFWIVNNEWAFSPIYDAESMLQWQRVVRSMEPSGGS